MRRLLALAAMLTLVAAAAKSQMVSGSGSAGSSGAAGRQINQWYDVTDTTFGAAGDSATNDYAAIQEALDSCYTAGGGTVYFPPGVYVVQDTFLTVRGGGVRLVGQGFAQNEFDEGPNRGTTLLFWNTQAADTLCPGIIVGDSTANQLTEGYTFENIMFATNRDGGFGLKDIIQMWNVEYSSFERCSFFGRQMMEHDNTLGVDSMATLVKVQPRGDATNEGSAKILWEGCQFYGAGSGGSAVGPNYGIWILAPASDADSDLKGYYNNAHTISNCFFENFASPGRSIMYQSTGSACTGHLVTNTRLDGDDGGIELAGSYNFSMVNSIIDFNGPDGDTAIWVNPGLREDANTGNLRDGSSAIYGGHIDGLAISDHFNSRNKLQVWSHTYSAGPHFRGIHLEALSSAPGIPVLEDTTDGASLHSLNTGEVIRVTSDGVDTLNVRGDPAVPRGYVDISHPPFLASPLDSLTNAATIKAAIDTAYVRGAGGIYIPPGEWVCGGDSAQDVDINLAPGVHVVGAGTGATILREAANSTRRSTLRLSGDSECTIRDLTIDGNYDGRNYDIMQNGRVWGILIIGPCNDVTVRDVELLDVSSGIYMGGGGDICGTTIEGVEIVTQSTADTLQSGRAIDQIGIRLSDAACGTWIRNTYISGGYPDSASTQVPSDIFSSSMNAVKLGIGLDIWGEDTRVDGLWVNDFRHGSEGDGLRGGIGVRVYSTAKRTTLSDLSLTHAGRYGIAVAGSTVAINGLQVRRCFGDAIHLGTGAYQVTLDPNNVFTNVDSARVRGAGFPAALASGLYHGSRHGVDAVPDTLFLKRSDTDATLTLVK